MRRHRNPDFETKDLIVIGGVVAGVYVLYKILSKVPQAATNALQTITAPISNSIAQAWTAMTLAPPMQGVPGNVLLPDGTNMGPLASMTIKSDSAGNVYIMAGDTMYQLGQSDANGNWPVQLVIAPDFGVTGTSW
jgi:hypothetical protein